MSSVMRGGKRVGCAYLRFLESASVTTRWRLRRTRAHGSKCRFCLTHSSPCALFYCRVGHRPLVAAIGFMGSMVAQALLARTMINPIPLMFVIDFSTTLITTALPACSTLLLGDDTVWHSS